MKRMLLVVLFLVGYVLLGNVSTSFAQFQPNAGDPPPAGAQPPWGHQLSFNHNEDGDETTIPYFFPPGEPENPYDLIWHSWMRIDISGFPNPASYAGIYFDLYLQSTYQYWLTCGWGHSSFNTTYNNSLIYETSVTGSYAEAGWYTVNGQAIGKVGLWCEEDD